jgi:hypothetical protein
MEVTIPDRPITKVQDFQMYIMETPDSKISNFALG